jgi:methylaspartate mutase epsilon subunit
MTGAGTAATLGRFAGAVAAARRDGELLVQPRMGFPTVAEMATGLRAVRAAGARTVGTITLDSYTRVGDHQSALAALRTGAELNGYPIVAHGAEVTRELVRSTAGIGFPVQVRHGSPLPLGIFEALADAGLDATEGGPVSYCLPYSRTPLAEAVTAWARCCELLAERVPGAHLESFGGCMLGQLCPPSLLIALSVLEGLFFRQHGLRSVSLSYTQQTSHAQDLAALAALRALAGERLAGIDWHVVLYTYMGVFPRTEDGALALLRRSARLAAASGTERMIVKTQAEAHRIPTIADNVRALEQAALAYRSAPEPDEPVRPEPDEVAELYQEAATLVDAVLELDPDVGTALLTAFHRGYLDVPFCLHTDNAQQSRSVIDATGRLRWAAVGRMPIRAVTEGGQHRLAADDLLVMLSHVQRSFDRPALDGAAGRPPLPPAPAAGS